MDDILVDQSLELSVSWSEVSDLKAMMSVLQGIIMNQNKQISDIKKGKAIKVL